MGTSCVIGYGPKDKFKGIYVHYDGNIESVGMQLTIFLAAHGFLEIKKLVEGRKAGMRAFNLHSDLSLKPDFNAQRPESKYLDYSDMGNVSYFYDVTPKSIKMHKGRHLIKTVKIESVKEFIVQAIFETEEETEFFMSKVGQKLWDIIS